MRNKEIVFCLLLLVTALTFTIEIKARDGSPPINSDDVICKQPQASLPSMAVIAGTEFANEQFQLKEVPPCYDDDELCPEFPASSVVLESSPPHLLSASYLFLRQNEICNPQSPDQTPSVKDYRCKSSGEWSVTKQTYRTTAPDQPLFYLRC